MITVVTLSRVKGLLCRREILTPPRRRPV
jgi:hypothetical protein